MTTFGELCCEVCGVKGSVTPMFRANAKGERGKWRCRPCLETPIDRTVEAMTDWFQTDNIAQREFGTAPGTPPFEVVS